MARYYVDTCIWRDYLENRSDRFRPLGEWAFEFIKKINKENHTVVFSNIIQEELLGAYSQAQIDELLSMFENIIMVKAQAMHADIAWSLSRQRNLPMGDAIHALLARQTCAILITRDRHMETLSDIAIVKKPEDLL